MCGLPRASWVASKCTSSRIGIACRWPSACPLCKTIDIVPDHQTARRRAGREGVFTGYSIPGLRGRYGGAFRHDLTVSLYSTGVEGQASICGSSHAKALIAGGFEKMGVKTGHFEFKIRYFEFKTGYSEFKTAHFQFKPRCVELKTGYVEFNRILRV